MHHNFSLAWRGHVILLVAAGIYAALCLSLQNAPLQDLPNHLTRAHIIADLVFNHGAVYGGLFALHGGFYPYLASDLVLASVDRLVGVEWTLPSLSVQ